MISTPWECFCSSKHTAQASAKAAPKEGVIAGKPLAKSVITSFRGSFKIKFGLLNFSSIVLCSADCLVNSHSLLIQVASYAIADEKADV